MFDPVSVLIEDPDPHRRAQAHLALSQRALNRHAPDIADAHLTEARLIFGKPAAADQRPVFLGPAPAAADQRGWTARGLALVKGVTRLGPLRGLVNTIWPAREAR